MTLGVAILTSERAGSKSSGSLGGGRAPHTRASELGDPKPWTLNVWCVSSTLESVEQLGGRSAVSTLLSHVQTVCPLGPIRWCIGAGGLTLHCSSVVRCGGLAKCPAVDTNPPAALANSHVISGRTTLGRLDGLRRNAEAAAWQTAHLAQVGCGTRVFGDRGVCYSAVQLHFLEYTKWRHQNVDASVACWEFGGRVNHLRHFFLSSHTPSGLCPGSFQTCALL